MQSLINRKTGRDKANDASPPLPSIGCYVNEESAKAHQIARPNDQYQAPKRQIRHRFLIFTIAVLIFCFGLFIGLQRHLKDDDSLLGFASDFGKSMLSFIQFPIEQIHIVGHEKTSEKDITGQLGDIWDTSLLALNTYVAQSKIEKLPWVRRAVVERVFPHGLNVYVEERQAIGRWVTINGTYVFDKEGFIITPIRVGEFLDLPMYDGIGAPIAAHELRNMMARFSDLNSSIVRFTRVGERRWTLHFKNDLSVLLPEFQREQALSRLKSLHEQHNILNRALDSIDLRLSDRVTLKPKISNNIKTITIPETDNFHPEGGNQIKRNNGVKIEPELDKAEGI